MLPVRSAVPSPLSATEPRGWNVLRPLAGRAGWVPVLIWGGLALAIGLKALASPERHSVWPVFAAASHHWWEDRPLYRYYPGLDMYRYSPTFAVAVTPLAVLPLRAGGCIWGAGGILLLYAGLRALHRDVLADRAGLNGRVAFLALAAVGIAPMGWNLQSNVLVLALTAFGTAAAARGLWWRAAAALAAPVFIKLWPVAWVAVVVAGRPRPLVPRVAVVLAALAAVPLLVASPDTAARVYGEWEYVLRVGNGLRWPGYRDLLTVCELAGLPLAPAHYRAAQLVGGCVVLIAALAAGRRDRRRGLAVGLAGWLCWQLLLGPGSERNTYGLIVPVMAWEVLRACRNGPGWVWPAAALAAVLLFSSGDVERAVGRTLPGAAAALPSAVIAFALWLVFQGIRPGKPVEHLPPTVVVGPLTAQPARGSRPGLPAPAPPGLKTDGVLEPRSGVRS